eukprot:8950742-Pyramimonas_sp.AAC.1
MMFRACRVPRAGMSRMSRLIRSFCQDFLGFWQDVSSEMLVFHYLLKTFRAKRWFCKIWGCLERGPRGGPRGGSRIQKMSQAKCLFSRPARKNFED